MDANRGRRKLETQNEIEKKKKKIQIKQEIGKQKKKKLAGTTTQLFHH